MSVKKTEIIAKVELGIAGFFAVSGVATLAFLIISSLDFFGKVSDLPEYYVPAKLIAEGRGAETYNSDLLGKAQNQTFPSLDGRTISLFIPPPGLAVLSPIAIIPAEQIRLVWKALIFASVAASVFVLAKLLALSLKQVFYLIAAITLSQAAFEMFRIDQVAGFLLLAFSLSLYWLEKGKLSMAGVGLCVLLVLKPQHALPYILLMAGAGRWRVFPALAVTLVVLTTISILEIRPDGLITYFELLRDPASTFHQQPELSPTLRGQLLRFLPQQEKTIFMITSLIYALMLGFSFYLGRIIRHRNDWLWLGIVVLAPISAVLSVHCHSYDLLLLVPSLVLVFQDRGVPTPSIMKLVIMFGGMSFMLPLSIIVHYNYLLKGGVPNPAFFALFAYAALILWFGIAAIKKGSPDTPNIETVAS